MKFNSINSVVQLLFVVSISWVNGVLVAQTLEQNLPPASGERIQIISDRNVYTVSEDVYYSCLYELSLFVPYEYWSKVMYVELIGWDGVSYAQSKVSISNNQAQGTLELPSGIKSGNYYLRAYTRWMRNYDPLTYAYLPIKIVNPATEDLYPGPAQDFYPNFPVFEWLAPEKFDVSVSGLKDSYGPREKVTCKIQFNPAVEASAFESIAVVPAGLSVNSSGSFDLGDSVDEDDGEKIDYYPELEGISLTAVVLDKRTKEPVPGMKVSLSSFTNDFFFGADKSDESGQVFFSLPPYHGNYEFYMVTEGEGREEVELLINNDFCNKPVTLPYIPFELSKEEKENAELMVRNAQLAGRFDTSTKEITDLQLRYPFYGKPYSVTIEDDFIQLIDLKEFFFELVPSVSVYSLNKNPYLVVHSETSLEPYPALIMIDNIPVDNDAEMLTTPCSMIDRVEVVNSGFIAGPYKYSGIVSIYSLNKDIAGYSLPDNSHFFNFSMFNGGTRQGKDQSRSSQMDRIPDLRNTLFWNPHVNVNAEGTVTIEYYTSDVKGTYDMVIRRLKTDGGLKEHILQFEVR